MLRKKTLVWKILAGLIRGERMSHITAVRDYRCARLADAIHRLRRMGFDMIEMDRVKAGNGNFYGVYYIRAKHRKGARRQRNLVAE